MGSHRTGHLPGAAPLCFNIGFALSNNLNHTKVTTRRARVPASHSRDLLQPGDGHFQLKLALGVGVVHTADHDRFPGDQQRVPIDFDLSYYRRRKCPDVLPGLYIQAAVLRPDRQYQFIAVLS